MTERRFRVGADIGGTFTDLVMIDDVSGQTRLGKVLTNNDDPSRGVMEGLLGMLAEAGVAPEEVTGVIHGTTLVTNALIERKGVPTALLTTEGHRDALEIRREGRYDLYDIYLENPEPLVPRNWRYGVNERIYGDGTVARSLDEDQVRELIATLKAEGVRACAVCLLHSYKNSTHERRIGELFTELAPEIAVSLSHEVISEIREYERTSTTVCNVYVQPLTEGYLKNLENALRDRGVQGRLYVMLSSGGICTVETAQLFPVRLLESGPAAGALAASFYAKLTGMKNLLSFDMGGTTAKACLLEDGEPLVTTEFEVARMYRFKKGSGMPVKIPVIDMIEIGAGGGSIARVDSMGLLKVGPDSASSRPGPVCYGLGGSEPTVTDADLMLGYLDPSFFLGGKMQLGREEAARAIRDRVADRLGLDPVAAAWGIHRVVNESMASAARVHAIEKGKDLRQHTMFAFGGAGPVHAYRVAEILRVREVMIPVGAGVASAFGFLAAPLAFDFVRSIFTPLKNADWTEINAAYAAMEEEGRVVLREAGVPDERMTFTRTCDLRYQRQGSEINVTIPDRLGTESVPTIQAEFERTYTELYGRINAEAVIEAVSWRLIASGPKPRIQLAEPLPGVGIATARKGSRQVYWPEHGGFSETPVYDRYRLAPGDVVSGPAIIEERESTTVVGPKADAHVDRFLNLVLRWKA